jgi:hypothetical protein
LRAEGRAASRGRVERLMRRHGIRALAGRRFRPCTTRAQGGMHPRRTVSPLMLGMDPLHVVEELPVGLEKKAIGIFAQMPR